MRREDWIAVGCIVVGILGLVLLYGLQWWFR